MHYLYFALIGLAAGWLAGQIMKTPNQNLVVDLIVGVIGAILGGFVFGLLGFVTASLLASLITATVGAIILIAGLRYLNKKT